MKSSKNLKVGVTLLVAALAVGVFALVVWADGNGINGMGMGRGLSVNNESPRCGMQDKEFSNQMLNQDCEGCEDYIEGQGNGMERSANAPDDD